MSSSWKSPVLFWAIFFTSMVLIVGIVLFFGTEPPVVSPTDFLPTAEQRALLQQGNQLLAGQQKLQHEIAEQKKLVETMPDGEAKNARQNEIAALEQRLAEYQAQIDALTQSQAYKDAQESGNATAEKLPFEWPLPGPTGGPQPPDTPAEEEKAKDAIAEYIGMAIAIALCAVAAYFGQSWAIPFILSMLVSGGTIDEDTAQTIQNVATASTAPDGKFDATKFKDTLKKEAEKRLSKVPEKYREEAKILFNDAVDGTFSKKQLEEMAIKFAKKHGVSEQQVQLLESVLRDPSQYGELAKMLGRLGPDDVLPFLKKEAEAPGTLKKWGDQIIVLRDPTKTVNDVETLYGSILASGAITTDEANKVCQESIIVAFNVGRSAEQVTEARQKMEAQWKQWNEGKK